METTRAQILPAIEWALETSLVEWKRKWVNNALTLPDPLETSLVEWKQAAELLGKSEGDFPWKLP